MGWSDRIGQVRRLSERIDDLDRLGRALAIDGPVVTVAHDWGGPVSLGWALAHRDQLAGVVLTNTAVHQPPGSPAPALIRMARTPPMLASVCRRTPIFVRATTALSRPALPRAVRDAFAAPYSSPERRRAVADFVADIPLEDDHPSMPTLRALADDVRTLDVPVLLAWGPRDPVFSDLYLRDLIERLPHADVHRYEGASHLVTEDAPAALDDIRAWVERLPAPGSPVGLAADPVPTPRRRRGARSGPPSSSGPPTPTPRPPAVVELGDAGSTLTWAQLDGRVRDLAAGLTEVGVRRGDRVALLVPPGADLATVVYACLARRRRRRRRRRRPRRPRAGPGAARCVAPAPHRRRPRPAGGPGTADRRATLRRRLPDPGPGPAARRRRDPDRSLRARPRQAAARAAGTRGRGRGRLHLGCDGARQGRGLSAPPGRGQPRHAHRLYDLTPEDRIVAAFAPFALYGPAMGIASAVPDMDVTSPATLTAARLADAALAVDATLVWASPASLRNVVATQGELTPASARPCARCGCS